jgi:glucokinase
MDSRTKCYLCIDAGGTYLKSGILTLKGNVLQDSAQSVKSFSKGPQKKIIQAFENMVSKSLRFIGEKGMGLEGICIAFPGPFDYENGIPLMKHKFSAIYGLNMRNYIYDIPGVSPEIPIRFMHDANAALVGELWKGNAKGFTNTALVTLGTGLGFSFSQNGEIQYNHQGGPAISIFRLPYKDGILEDYASKRGFLKIYQEKSGKSSAGIKVSEIGKLADEGDIGSIETFKEIGNILAAALYNILDKMGIQCLLFGGQISRSFHHMEESLKEGLKNIKSLQKISLVKNIDNASLYGILWKILNQ